MTALRATLVTVALVATACSSGGGSSGTTGATTTSAPGAPSVSAPSTTSAASSSGAADWPMSQHDTRRRGFVAGAAGVARTVWQSDALDGQVYGEPVVAGGKVVVATTHDTVYAFDASTGAPAWKQSIGQAVPAGRFPCGNVDPVGITSAPVIDVASGRVFVVGMVAAVRHELVALSLDDGHELFRRVVDAPGADPRVHNQRGALALANGKVYVPFGGRLGDCGAYQGRVVAAPADNAGDLHVYTVPTAREAGIWAPTGPAVDSKGDVWTETGNSASRSRFDYGNSVLRLSPTLEVLDYWAPSDWLQRNVRDIDLGSVSPALLDGGRVFATGKEGVGYLLDAGHLGGIGGELASTKVCGGSGAFGGLATDGTTVYVACRNGLVAVNASGDHLRVAWQNQDLRPGPPIRVGGTVWVIDVSAGRLVGLDASSGRETARTDVGSVTHFSAPSYARGLLYAAGGGHLSALSL